MARFSRHKVGVLYSKFGAILGTLHVSHFILRNVQGMDQCPFLSRLFSRLGPSAVPALLSLLIGLALLLTLHRLGYFCAKDQARATRSRRNNELGPT